MYLQSTSDKTPGIFFYPSIADSSSGANIQYDESNDLLKFMGGNVHFDSSLITYYSVYTGDKTSMSDGLTGAVLGNNVIRWAENGGGYKQ